MVVKAVCFLRLSPWSYGSECFTFGSTEFVWRFGDWTSCSASCGNRGTWLRRIRCVTLDGKDVQPTMCQHTPKPFTSPVPCNRQDCPARYTCMQTSVTHFWKQMSDMLEYGGRMTCHVVVDCMLIYVTLCSDQVTDASTMSIFCGLLVFCILKHLQNQNVQFCLFHLNIFI